MSVSHSSSSNNSLHSSNLSTFSPFCHNHNTAQSMNTIYNCTYCTLVLPLSIVVLCLGVQRWKQQGASVAAMSHSDFFTYNMAAMELIAVLGLALSMYSRISELPETSTLATHISAFPWNAQMLFPTLICVERYQAVAHPATYIRLRQTAGLRIRHISTACIWLQCVAGASTIMLYPKSKMFSLMPACLLATCLITMTFCSLSILRVLIRPRPGKVGQDRIQVDKLKRKAFKTVIIIMWVLSFRFGASLVSFLLNSSSTVNESVQCVAMVSSNWFTLPSSLVLPLLFLQRNGIIPRCKNCTKPG